MPEIIRKPSRPTTVETVLRWGGSSLLPITQFKPLMNAPGSFTSCDVWFEGPEEYAPLFVRLFAKNGTMKVPLQGRRTIEQSKAIWKDQGGGRWSALLFSVRNRPCDGFLLEAAGEPIKLRSRWRMECWWDLGSVYSDDAGRIMVDPWGINGDPASYNVTHYVSPRTGLVVGLTTMVSATPAERWDLIYASIITGDAVNRNISFETFPVPPVIGPVVNKLNANLDMQSGQFQYQGSGLPGTIGHGWRINLPAATGVWLVDSEFRKMPAYPVT